MTVSKVEQTRISLSWEVSTTCFESVDFTVTISWNPCSGEEQVTNVSGSSYDITGLTPGVRYDITLVANGDGVRSGAISISTTTLSSSEHMYIYVHIVLSALRSISFTKEKGTHLCIEFTAAYCHCAERPFRRIPLLISSTGLTASRSHQATTCTRLVGNHQSAAFFFNTFHSS